MAESTSTSNLEDKSTLEAQRDVLMSIKPEHINNIATAKKNHEYRKYKLPASVERIWFYTTAPTSAIQYIAFISGAKEPGEVPEDGGIGNADFNAGKKVSKFGYEILGLWELQEPLSLVQAMEKGYLNGPPQKYSWVKQQLLVDYPLRKQKVVIVTDAGRI